MTEDCKGEARSLCGFKFRSPSPFYDTQEFDGDFLAKNTFQPLSVSKKKKGNFQFRGFPPFKKRRRCSISPTVAPNRHLRFRLPLHVVARRARAEDAPRHRGNGKQPPPLHPLRAENLHARCSSMHQPRHFFSVFNRASVVPKDSESTIRETVWARPRLPRRCREWFGSSPTGVVRKRTTAGSDGGRRPCRICRLRKEWLA